MKTNEEITTALSEPFEPSELKWRAGATSGDRLRCLALVYVDARVVQDRLDHVLGVEGWQDEYEVLDDGQVVCRLRLKIGGEWITKVDVGGPSEQPDGGARMKAAFSDALKRAAVKFGIGRYLYNFPQQWVDYDPQRKQLKAPPKLPPFALKCKPGPAPAKPAAGLPSTAAELLQRLQTYEAKLVAAGVCASGQMLAHVQAAGEKAGHGREMAKWPQASFQLASDEVKAFELQARNQRQTQVAPAQQSPTPPASEEFITYEQASEICKVLFQHGIRTKGANGLEMADCSGIFAKYQITTLAYIPRCHYDGAQGVLALCLAKHPSILPPKTPQPTSTTTF